jgi:long-chain acyl-CoA synthetase
LTTKKFFLCLAANFSVEVRSLPLQLSPDDYRQGFFYTPPVEIHRLLVPPFFSFFRNLNPIRMNSPWFAKYPKGIPQEIGPYEYESLIDLFEVAARKYPNRVAFENYGKQITFEEVDRLSTAFAAYLQTELKLQKGDRIAIQIPNLIQFPIAFMGSIKAGLIAVNTNPLYTPHEMLHQFNDAGISAIVIVSNYAHQLELIQDKISVKHIIVTDMGDMLGGFKGAIMNFIVKYVKKLVPRYSFTDCTIFKNCFAKGPVARLSKTTNPY